MKEKLLYFNIKGTDKNILLYTAYEPYAGKDGNLVSEFIKVYAEEIQDNKELATNQMSEELHAKIRNIITSLGKGEISEIDVLDDSSINDYGSVGKPFAIPKVFLQNINKIKHENIKAEEISDTTVIDNVSSEMQQEFVPEGGSSLKSNNPDNSEKLSDPVETINENKKESYDSFTKLAEKTDESKAFIDSVNLGYPEQKSINETNTQNLLINTTENAFQGNDDMPSIESIDSAIETFKRVLNCLEKVKKEHVQNNMNSEKKVDESELPSSAEIAVDKNIVASNNSSAFPEEFDDAHFFVESSVKQEGPEFYTANVNDETQSVLETNASSTAFQDVPNASQEPVVMPDNFFGNDKTPQPVEGLSPSTLNESGDIFKFAA